MSAPPIHIKSEPLAEVLAAVNDEDGIEAYDAVRALPSQSESGVDKVVREIDVFLSPQLGSQMYLMQYPLQQTERAMPVTARVKPRHRMVELDFEVESHTDGGFGHFQMRTRTYDSQTIPVATHLVLGKMVSDKGEGGAAPGLHLVPLSHVTQMRPTFDHVDEATSNATSTAEEELKRERSDAAKLERKPLNFTKKESERAALARKSSYAYKKASEESESWQTLDVYLDDTVSAKVPCPSPETTLLKEPDNKDGTNVPATNQTYVDSLNYLPQQQITKETEAGELDSIERVCTKLVRLMQRGWPIPFSLLRSQFPPTIPDDSLLTALESCAFFVRGNYAIQSRLLPLSHALAQARTFILYILHTMDVLHRPRLAKVFADVEEMNEEAATFLLEQVGKKTANGWKLKVEDDVEFATDNLPKLRSHLDFWRRQGSNFADRIKVYESDA